MGILKDREWRVKESSQAKYSKYGMMRRQSGTCNDDKVCPLRAMCGKRGIGRRVSRRRALVASADDAWAIRGLGGTGAKRDVVGFVGRRARVRRRAWMVEEGVKAVIR